MFNLKNIIKNKKSFNTNTNFSSSINQSSGRTVITVGSKTIEIPGACNSVTVVNGKVKINGKVVNIDDMYDKNTPLAEVTVNVYGNVETIDTVGEVYVQGNVNNNIKTVGEVTVGGSVGGDINTVGPVTVKRNIQYR